MCAMQQDEEKEESPAVLQQGCRTLCAKPGLCALLWGREEAVETGQPNEPPVKYRSNARAMLAINIVPPMPKVSTTRKITGQPESDARPDAALCCASHFSSGVKPITRAPIKPAKIDNGKART